MDIYPALVYTIGIGGGALIGASANVLLAYKMRGEAYMMRMPDHKHIPMALAGAAAGALFAHTAMQPRPDARYYQQPTGVEYQDTRPVPDVVADAGGAHLSR